MRRVRFEFGGHVVMTTPKVSAHAVRQVFGICHHDCPDSCGWVVDVADDAGESRAVRLRGDATHPFSQGTLCPKVNRFLDRVHHPDRVLHPMRRSGPKGDGRFEQVAWADALSEIADRTGEALDRWGGSALLPIVSAGNQSLLAGGFGGRLWNALGATQLTGGLCGVVASSGARATNGSGRGLDPSELRHSRLIVLWGANTRLTNRHLWPVIEAARADGAQLVVIDPLKTVTASAADWWLQPRPGTDVAMMLAVMHELIRRDLVDHPWIAEHTVGFEALATHVESWTPAKASSICGVSAADIQRFADVYGTVRPVAIRSLVGPESHRNGAMFFRTLSCLPALVGAWRDRGGGHARSTAAWTASPIDFDALERPDLGGERRSLPFVQVGRTLADTTLRPPINVVFVVGANPMVSFPNTESLRSGFARDDVFTVVHEQFMTDTARYADLVLPATTQLESTDVVQPWGHMYLGWNNAAIEPMGESVSNSELHRRIAGALQLTEPALFESDRVALAAALPGVDLDDFQRRKTIRVPYPDDGRPYGDGSFATTSGRVQLAISDPDEGVPALPDYRAGEPLRDDEFVLMTPKRHVGFLNSSYAHLASHQPPTGPLLELHPDDARRLGFAEGDHVVVASDRGSTALPCTLSDDMLQGVVAIPWGWWAGHDDRVANSLTTDELTDWGEGATFGDTVVTLRLR